MTIFWYFPSHVHAPIRQSNGHWLVADMMTEYVLIKQCILASVFEDNVVKLKIVFVQHSEVLNWKKNQEKDTSNALML